MEATLYTTNVGQLMPRGILPRISIKEKPNEEASSGILILPSVPLSSPLEWDYRWVDPVRERTDWGDTLTNLRERLINPLYGRDILDAQLDEMAAAAPSIEQVWKITESWPSLTKILLEDRNNE